MENKKNNVIIWSPIHAKNYERIYKKLTEDSPKFFINKNIKTYLTDINKNDLITYIKHLNLSPSTKETFFFTVARYYEYNKINLNDLNEFKNEGYKIKQTRDTRDGDNKLEGKEETGYIEYSILKSLIKNNLDDVKTRREHMKFLFYNLLINTPVRSSYYYTAEILQTDTIPDTKKNYILINKNKVTLYIGFDKVSNNKKFIDEDLKYIKIEDIEFIKLLNKSILTYPRKYFLEIEENKKLNENYILKFLREITANENVNVDMVRSSYVTAYSKKNLTYNQKKKEADRLRHSPDTAQRAYNKIINDVNKDGDNDINKVKKLLEIENIKLKREILELTEQNNAYEKILIQSKEATNKTIDTTKIKIDNDPKILRKMRTDYLYKLNNNKIKKPNEKLIKLYGIIYTDNNKMYA